MEISVVEIKNAIESVFCSDKYNRSSARMFNSRHGDMVSHIRELYGNPENRSVAELCYCFYHGKSEFPVCSCGKQLEFRGFHIGYRNYCSASCRYKDLDALSKAKEARHKTMLEKYGVENVFMLKSVQDKAERTKLEKYGDSHYSNHKKAEETLLKKYGSRHPGSCVEIREKIEKTMIDRYGVKCPFSSEGVREKSRNTMLERYGVSYSAQCPDIYEKVKRTNAMRYGDPFPSRTDTVRMKFADTMRRRYGVDHYSQTIEYHTKRRHRYFSRNNPDISFNSTWESEVYDCCLSMGITPIVAPCAIPYYVDGKRHMYIPDFEIAGRLVEVKGDQFVKDGTWMIPYGRKESMSEDRFEHFKKQFDAKCKCAAENGVIVIGSAEMRNLPNVITKIVGSSCRTSPRSLPFNTFGIGHEQLLDICMKSDFPGTAKWPKDHFIWSCSVCGKMSPLEGWKNERIVSSAISNMFRALDRAVSTGKEQDFVVLHEAAFRSASEGRFDDILRRVLNRLTIAKIAPKVTAIQPGLVLSEIERTGIDLSGGVYCPMAGFGGLVEGSRRWMIKMGICPEGKIYAADINENLCLRYGWEKKDVLSDVVRTDRIVVACPPFDDREKWPGTPDDMYKTFEEWVRLIKRHVKAPGYAFFGPVTKTDGKRPQIYARNMQARLYDEYCGPSED